eukprot:scaffold8176_cov430-Prasinococcus_capsulatus_cf.AAC.1
MPCLSTAPPLSDESPIKGLYATEGRVRTFIKDSPVAAASTSSVSRASLERSDFALESSSAPLLPTTPPSLVCSEAASTAATHAPG